MDSLFLESSKFKMI